MLSFSRAHDGAFLLQAEQVFPKRRDDVFPFFADARNLQEITPPNLGFRILTSEADLRAMRAGRLIDYRIRMRGLPMRWRTCIMEWNPPRSFVDEQLRGPYALWRHEHTFDEIVGPDGEQWTRMRDRVLYRPPFGRVIGGMANRFFVQRELRAIFTHRRDVLVARFGEADVTLRATPGAGLPDSAHKSGIDGPSAPSHVRG